MGYGDFKLLGAIGAWLGWQVLPVVILLSSLVGAVVGISLMVFGKHGRETPIPFGPYLAAAGRTRTFLWQTAFGALDAHLSYLLRCNDLPPDNDVAASTSALFVIATARCVKLDQI